MIDLAMLQVVRDLVAIFGVIAGFTYYVMTVRNAQRSRQAQMLMQLHQSKYDKEGTTAYFTLLNQSWNDFNDYWENVGGMGNIEFNSLLETQMSYFEGLGVLVRDNVVNVNTVYDMMGRRIVSIWMKYETVIKGLRKLEVGGPGPGPDYSENFEYLANEMIKIRQKKGLPLYEYNIHPTSTQFKKET